MSETKSSAENAPTVHSRPPSALDVGSVFTEGNPDAGVCECARVQSALRASEERFRSLAAATAQIVWITDAQGKLIESQGWSAFTGQSQQEMEHGNWLKYVHPDEREQIAQTWASAVADKRRYDVEHRLLRYDGAYEWFEVHGVPLLDAGGNIREWVGTSANIQARKQAEQGARATHQQMEDIINSIGEVFFAVDADWQFTYVNPVVERFWNKGRDELLGRSLWDIFPQAVGTHSYEQLMQAASERKARHYETFSPIVQKPIAVDAYPNRDGLLIFWRDLTERERDRERIQTLNERLRRSLLEMDHRVRNNMQVITALVEVLKQANTEPSCAAALDHIGQHTRSLGLLHDLLAKAAKDESETAALSMRSILDQLTPLLQASAGNRSVVCQAEEAPLPVQEMASLAILVNELVSNAIQHGSGDIELTLRVREGQARLEVCDNGPGFPSGFDPLHAAKTGLELVDSTGRYDLRGQITFETRPEGGARVIVTFPLPEYK